jgi:dTDP-4-dehydrorhamnose reductase
MSSSASTRDHRWLVTGAAGMLGHDLLTTLNGRDVRGLTRAELDICSFDDVLAATRGVNVVVNAAAWTAVDDAESSESEAFAANATGVANLARACEVSGAWLVHVSTDYVFAGDATTPYDEDAAQAPRAAYGRTKAAGEWAVLAYLPNRSYIVRSAWLYGEHGPSFVRTMNRLATERDTVDVVDDQVGQPTWTMDLARRLVEMVDADIPAGVYHGTAAGQTSWFGLARRVFELGGHDPERVHATTSDRFPRPAPRPAYSVLGHRGWAATGLEPMRSWQDALDAAWPVVAFAPA